MAQDDNNVSLIALAVALLALVIAAGQLLQQMFGTAEGYRRCQGSVIGPWARRTRLSWRWKGFRFETKFTTPTIVLRADDGKPDEADNPSFFLTLENQVNTYPDELLLTLDPNAKLRGPPWRSWLARRFDRQTDEQNLDIVTWPSLLKSIYEHEKSLFGENSIAVSELDGITVGGAPSTKVRPALSSPVRARTAVRLCERSWDLIPPDVVRPFAQTSLGTILVLANRLGMRWRDFQPSQGIWRAEGNGHSISSTSIRGLGTLVEYKRNKNYKGASSAKFIPTEESDKMYCGIIPCSNNLGLTEDISLTGEDDNQFLLQPAFMSLGLNPETRENLLKNKFPQVLSTENLIVCEMVALLSPFMPLRDSCLVEIVWPVRVPGLYSMFLFWEARAVLKHRLGEEPSVQQSATLQHIRDGLQLFETRYPNDFYCRWNEAVIAGKTSKSEKLDLIEHFRQEFNWTTVFFYNRFGEFEKGSEDIVGARYLKLLSAHLEMAAVASDKAGEADRGGGTRENEFLGSRGPFTVRLVLETAHMHVDRLHEFLVPRMSDRDLYKDDLAVEEAWWTMVYRGICWFATVYVKPTGYPAVPSYYYGSEMPVYIA